MEYYISQLHAYSKFSDNYEKLLTNEIFRFLGNLIAVTFLLLSLNPPMTLIAK